MKKRIISAMILALCMGSMLTGCMSAIPKMTEEEQEEITQYMADLLLKYDVNYQSALLTEDEIGPALMEQQRKEEEARLLAEEQERLEQEKLEASKPDEIETTDSKPKDGVEKLAEAIGMDGVEFDYLGYEICQQYPNQTGEDLYFVVTPTTGRDLLVIKLNLSNVSGADYEIDMKTLGTTFAIKVNDGSYGAVLSAWLENDLSMLMTTIPSEMGMEVILVTEVMQGTQIDTLNVYVRTNEGNRVINLQ